ncbi:MAG TPA: BPL-N domain-containing protein [Candidatus Sulfotelmatobacter sp.]|nr:BPL-N domain-containing protein [Candidatus Sulfotelmatobacter sp.]
MVFGLIAVVPMVFTACGTPGSSLGTPAKTGPVPLPSSTPTSGTTTSTPSGSTSTGATTSVSGTASTSTTATATTGSTGVSTTSGTTTTSATGSADPTATDATSGGPVAPVANTTTAVPVLLFNGTGTISSDVSAVETVLSSKGLRYSTANSAQLNAMSEATLLTFRLFIVPGGNSITIGQSLTRTATTNVHNAIVNGGLHYLGICAGGFFGGYSIYNGLNLTNGVWFNVYADQGLGIGKEAVMIYTPSSGAMDQFWQDGPQFSHWGSVVAKYQDGTPAIAEGKSGNGWVILCGVHPEAPASWRYGMNFTTSAAVDNNYAATLVLAALNGTWLPHY